MNPLPVIRGRVAFVFAEPNFDVDRLLDFDAMRRHDTGAMVSSAMSAFDPEFTNVVRLGDVLVGGVNFGYGHPHGPPMNVMRSFGIAAVIAESFAPLYRMGEVTNGFPQLTCPGILDGVSRWDELSVDWDIARIVNYTRAASLPFSPPTSAEDSMLRAGGLFALLSSGHGAVDAQRLRGSASL